MQEEEEDAGGFVCLWCVSGDSHLGDAVGDVQELVGKQLSERQEHAGAEDFGVDASDAVDV